MNIDKVKEVVEWAVDDRTECIVFIQRDGYNSYKSVAFDGEKYFLGVDVGPVTWRECLAKHNWMDAPTRVPDGLSPQEVVSWIVNVVNGSLNKSV